MLPSISTEGLDYNLMKRVLQFDKIVWLGTEVVFVLLTQLPRVRISPEIESFRANTGKPRTKTCFVPKQRQHIN